MYKIVGAYEAKTHLPELLELASKGERTVITRRGNPIAILMPYYEEEAKLKNKAIEQMLKFKKQGLRGLKFKDLKETGRKW